MKEASLRELERQVGPVRFHDISRDALVEAIVQPSEKKRRIFNLNAHALNLAFRDGEFCGLLNEAEVCFCDGHGVRLLSWLCGYGGVRHRVTVPDFFHLVMEGLHRTGQTVYLLGDEPGVAEVFARQINERWPGTVVGWHHGFILKDDAVQERVVEEIRERKPAFVAVGMSMPLQEKWVARWYEKLPVAGYFVAGATFSWYTSHRKRGPGWLVDNGFEWLCRLATEPNRVWRRYLVGLPEVLVRLLWFRFFGQ